MKIRCPHCHNPIEVVDDAELSDVNCPSCGSSFDLALEDTVTESGSAHRTLGHFQLLHQVGIGAFGSVWRAQDTELDRIVAVKIPRRTFATRSDSEKFIREARAAAQLQHPNIVSVHEIGRDDGTLYIVSDYVEGVTLSDWISAKLLTTMEAASLCAKVCS